VGQLLRNTQQHEVRYITADRGFRGKRLRNNSDKLKNMGSLSSFINYYDKEWIKSTESYYKRLRVYNNRLKLQYIALCYWYGIYIILTINN
jgi:hypothetical protein